MKIEELEKLLKELPTENWSNFYGNYSSDIEIERYTEKPDLTGKNNLNVIRTYSMTEISFQEKELVLFLRNNAEKFLAVVKAAKIAVLDHHLQYDDVDSNLESLSDALDELEKE